MSICPVCNGLKQVTMNCPTCYGRMEEKGRVMDYFDQYSPYMPIDQLKMNDGYENNLLEKKCPHLFFCENCETDTVMFISEE